MHPVVLYQHKHIPPTMILILFKLLVLTLQTLQLLHVVPLNSNSIVLVLVTYLLRNVTEQSPVCIYSTNEILQHHLQYNTLLHTLSTSQLNQLLQR